MVDETPLNAADSHVAIYPTSPRTSTDPTNFDLNFCGLFRIHSYNLTVVIALFHLIIACGFLTGIYGYKFSIYMFLLFAIHCSIVILLILALVLKKSLFLLPFLVHQWIILFFSMAIAGRFGLSIIFPANFGLYPKKTSSRTVTTVGNMVVEDFWIEVMVMLVAVSFAVLSFSSLYVAHRCHSYLKKEEEDEYDTLPLYHNDNNLSGRPSSTSLSDTSV